MARASTGKPDKPSGAVNFNTKLSSAGHGSTSSGHKSTKGRSAQKKAGPRARGQRVASKVGRGK